MVFAKHRHLYAIISIMALFLQSTKAVYDRILDLKIANPQIIINFAVFLEEHHYFEESFKVIQLLNTKIREPSHKVIVLL